MRYYIFSILIIVGIFFIFLGFKLLKKFGKTDATLTEYRLIYFGIIGIILALLGFFSAVAGVPACNIKF